MKFNLKFFIVTLIFLGELIRANTVKADCYYDLPFKAGTTHRSLQGYHGDFSHRPPLQYAVDFEMTEGTPIYAARSGKVIALKSKSNSSGKTKDYLKKANFIRILHRDETIALYAHLKYLGVNVRKGQYVKRGQLLGYSGCTGFCDGPHLHFEVYATSNDPKIKRVSLPVKFWTSEGIVNTIQRQKNYTSDRKNKNPCL